MAIKISSEEELEQNVQELFEYCIDSMAMFNRRDRRIIMKEAGKRRKLNLKEIRKEKKVNE